MKKNKWLRFGYAAVGMAVIGFVASVAWADNEVVPFTPNAGGASITNAYVGVYYGIAKMTNGSQSFWITPPANTTNGTLTDISGFGPPYSSVVYAANLSAKHWCGTNTVTFPATNTTMYTLTVYIKSTPPPTNGQPITLQINWQ